MAIIAVSIMCIALIVVGGMALSQGILTSADSTALSVDSMSAREGELMRTEVTTLRAANQSWSEFLRVIVDNSGQTKLGNFSKWDVIVHYYDESGYGCLTEFAVAHQFYSNFRHLAIGESSPNTW